jgi:hypothetical protein
LITSSPLSLTNQADSFQAVAIQNTADEYLGKRAPQALEQINSFLNKRPSLGVNSRGKREGLNNQMERCSKTSATTLGW